MKTSLTDIETLQDAVGRALELAAARGASAAEAAFSAGIGLSVKVRLGEVDKLTHHRDQGMAVSVYFGSRKGTASTTRIDAEAIEETVRAACEIARYTAEDPCAGLAPAGLMATDFPDLDLYHPWELTVEQAIEQARECERSARDRDARLRNSDGAGVSSGVGLSVYGNSHGFLAGYSRSRHSRNCSMIASDDGGESLQRDHWYSAARHPDELESPEAVGRKAAERALRRLGGKRISTRTTPVVYAAEVAGGLLGHFIGAIRGGSLYRRSSFLLDHLGKPVFPAFVNIEEQPHLLRGLGSTPFDSEGVATARRDLVRDGVLASYVLDSYSACKLGLQTTGNAGGVHNLSIAPGTHDLDGLLREMGSGLLITELMGQGINMVTGDYSRGAAGFWVENGEIQYPVEEVTVAGNLKTLFMNLQAVGNDVDTRGNIRSGSWLLDGMTVAGS